MIPLDGWDSPLAKESSTKWHRKPGDFLRKGEDGAPLVSDPDGAIVKSGPRAGLPKMLTYGRASSLGKLIEDSYNLQRWSERRIVHGLIVGSDEMERRIERAVHSIDYRKAQEADEALDSVIAEARRIGKADLAAQMGTHAHALTEDLDRGLDVVARIERGEDLGLPAPVQRAMVDAWQRLLDVYGLEVLAVEQHVVNDPWRVAGTLDRIVRTTRPIQFEGGVTILAGTVLVLDVKTGKLRTDSQGNPKHWHSYACQLAAYATARPYDVDTDQRGRWWRGEDPSIQHALIAHLPVFDALNGEATARLIYCDLDAGINAVEHIVMRAKAWAKETPFLMCDMGDITVPVTSTSEWIESLRQAEAKPDRSVRHEFHTGGAIKPSVLVGDARMIIDEGGTANATQDTAIVERIGELTDQAKAVLDSLAKAAAAEGVPFSRRPALTVRRWHIYRSLLRLAAHFGDELEPDHIRATLALVIPDAAQLGVELGPAIGSLTIDEAQRLVEATQAVIAADPAIHIADDGVPSWLGVVVNPAA